MKIGSVITKDVLEGTLFLLTTVFLFNSLTDFSFKVGILTQTLQMQDIQHFGYLSTSLAALNAVSHKFFGFTIVQ